ncbi:MAG: hypothetical protein CMG55_08025 [Candidatus Marinimicrobia bacterium]|nr:hypothetical protein [Candidatus Neomarinimicrobiota bacterium]|tara:strand:+ start:2124 stop:2447 length:324 start_codon:yes stop_codon:yes gene_type:complete
MQNKVFDKNKLKAEIFLLMDVVKKALEVSNVDDFLDTTDIFDKWEEILPEKEYPIFIMAVLNNIRKDSIIDTIIIAIISKSKSQDIFLSSDKDNKQIRSHLGEHPFN